MDEDPLDDLDRRLKRLERGNNLGYSSISEGSLRVASAEGLIVEGSQKIVGVLFGDGAIEWTGTARFSSPGTLEAGDSTFEDVKITQTLDVTAETTLRALVKLLSNLQLESGGRITVLGAVNMLIENGIISYASGATIAGSAGGVAITSGGGAQMQVASAVASISSGSNSIRSEGTGNVAQGTTDFQGDVLVNGLLYAAGISYAPIGGVPEGTLVMDPSSKRVYAAI